MVITLSAALDFAPSAELADFELAFYFMRKRPAKVGFEPSS